MAIVISQFGILEALPGSSSLKKLLALPLPWGIRLRFYEIDDFKRPAYDLAVKRKGFLGILSRSRALRGTEGRFHFRAAVKKQLGDLVKVFLGLPLADHNAFDPGEARDHREVMVPIVLIEGGGILGLTVVENTKFDHSIPPHSDVVAPASLLRLGCRPPDTDHIYFDAAD
jgi:hypothetical protein